LRIKRWNMRVSQKIPLMELKVQGSIYWFKNYLPWYSWFSRWIWSERMSTIRKFWLWLFGKCAFLHKSHKNLHILPYKKIWTKQPPSIFFFFQSLFGALNKTRSIGQGLRRLGWIGQNWASLCWPPNKKINSNNFFEGTSEIWSKYSVSRWCVCHHFGWKKSPKKFFFKHVRILIRIFFISDKKYFHKKFFISFFQVRKVSISFSDLIYCRSRVTM